MPVVEYEGGGWNRITIPEGGGVKSWGKDGLFNVYDSEDRVVDVKHGVRTYFPNDEEHPDHVGQCYCGKQRGDSGSDYLCTDCLKGK